MTDDKRPPKSEEALDSTELLIRRITAQLSIQLAQVRPPAARAARSAPLTR